MRGARVQCKSARQIPIYRFVRERILHNLTLPKKENHMEVTLMDMLDEIRKTYDLSILMTTHDFSMLPRYADQAVLIDGTIRTKGTPEEVLSSQAFRDIFHMKGGAL